MDGMTPAMRKMVRRSEASKSRTSDRQPLDPKYAAELAAKRILRRKVLEFWSKGAHGYDKHVLTYCRTVNLTSCSLVDDDGEALASELSNQMRNLKVINLADNKLGDKTLTALAIALARGAAPAVTELQLSHNNIGEAGLKLMGAALVGFEGFDDLRAGTFGDRDVIVRALPRLERLDLSWNALGSKGVGYLAQAAEGGALQRLTLLVLSKNAAVGDAGVEAIAKVAKDDEVLSRLTELNLRETAVTEAGLAALCETMMPTKGGLPCLRSLLVDEKLTNHAKLKEVYSARNGQGGVHAINLDHVVLSKVLPTWHMAKEVPMSARTPRVQSSPRFPLAGM